MFTVSIDASQGGGDSIHSKGERYTAMCNKFGHIHPLSAWQRRFNAISRPLDWAADAKPSNFQPQPDIRIRDTAAVIRTDGAAGHLTLTPWAWTGAHGKPVFNFRSDDRDFSRSDRVLIPADYFYEFTGTKTPKTPWRFTLAGEDMMLMAGVVREGAFAILTTEPGPDMAPIHNRQVVVLPDEGAWLAWSEGAVLPGVLAAGTLKAVAETVGGGVGCLSRRSGF